ncbi:unnamed protein product [Callosobruchus maculatus]|uniref:Uncharacterized protein n=1 Tax=Callosobruchus maculatus TaxID=64391 RepID=A0A653DRF2_CALMS|nr:unnamed protein product [Callosobruchus maculatus]
MSQRVQKIMENAKLIYSSTETAGNGPENLDMPIDLQRSNSYDFDNGQAAAPRNGSNCSVSTNILEDSDDSVGDRDYAPDPEDESSGYSDLEINSKNRDAQENFIYPGRPKKGRKRKYANQDRDIRKKRINSNQDYC